MGKKYFGMTDSGNDWGRNKRDKHGNKVSMRHNARASKEDFEDMRYKLKLVAISMAALLIGLSITSLVLYSLSNHNEESLSPFNYNP